MSPTLGWLWAFLAVADHNDYERAAQDLGISADQVKVYVEKLEKWLKKVLFDDHLMPHEGESDAYSDGLLFITVAWEALRSFEAACSPFGTSDGGITARERRELISGIHLYDLERFLAVADIGDFKGAAHVAQCDVTTLQRSIRALEKVAGTKLLSGRSMLALTDDGRKFRETAQTIVDSLHGFRAKIPADYNAARERAKRRYHILKLKRAELLLIKVLIEKTGRKQRGKARLADVEAALKFVADKMDEIEQEAGPFASSSGLDVDVSEFGFGPADDNEAGE